MRREDKAINREMAITTDEKIDFERKINNAEKEPNMDGTFGRCKNQGQIENCGGRSSPQEHLCLRC